MASCQANECTSGNRTASGNRSAVTMSAAVTPAFHLPGIITRRTFTPVDVKLLKQAAIFQDLDEGELARVTEVCREQKFTVGQYVFKEGEPGNRLFLISEGEVRISRTIPGSGEEALAILKPGSCFGEMSIFDRSEAVDRAIANTACTLIHDLPFRLRAPPRLQPRRGLQDLVVSRAAPVRAAARDERQSAVVPRDVHVLTETS